MNAKNTSLLVFGATILCAAAIVVNNRSSRNSTGPGLESNLPSDWKWISFDSFRIKTPQAWSRIKTPPQDNPIVFHGTTDGKPNLLPGMVPALGILPGTMLISEEAKPKKKTALKELFATDQRKFPSKTYPQILLGKPLAWAPPGGQCLAYKVRAKAVRRCDGTPPGTKLTCIQISIKTYCYSKAGAFFNMDASLALLEEGETPDAKTIERGRIFEKVLRSIEFL